MGLDMYLSGSLYVSDYNEEDKEVSEKVMEIIQVPKFSVETIKIRLAYWRKANQIHAWFVKNVQDGVDECQHADVSREQILKLLEDVNKVLANHELAEEILPAQSGFFFGSTEYDEYYFSDLEDTKTQLQAVIDSPIWKNDSWDFTYHSSW